MWVVVRAYDFDLGHNNWGKVRPCVCVDVDKRRIYNGWFRVCLFRKSPQYINIRYYTHYIWYIIQTCILVCLFFRAAPRTGTRIGTKSYLTECPFVWSLKRKKETKLQRSRAIDPRRSLVKKYRPVVECVIENLTEIGIFFTQSFRIEFGFECDFHCFSKND